MKHRVPRRNFSEYLSYILSRKNLSTLFYAIIGVFIIFLLTLIFLFLVKNMKMIFFIILLLLMGIISDSINRFLPFSLGIEFIMMGVILSSRVYSPIIGIMIGIIGLTVAELFIMRFKIGLLFSYVGIIMVGFLSHIFANSDITTTGIALTVFYDAFILPGYYFTGSNPVKLLIFGSTHILFNIWVFVKVAPVMLSLMT